MYGKGRGVPQDYATAVTWYRHAAEAGYADAQYNLGVMYRKGQGVPKDYAEAIKWYRRAAEAGDADAQAVLGIAYAIGKGVPQDYIAAHMWLNLAASTGDEKVTNFFHAIIASQMSPAEIERAQARAKKCLASDYQDCGG
jgi:TPR repeat protein